MGGAYTRGSALTYAQSATSRALLCRLFLMDPVILAKIGPGP